METLVRSSTFRGLSTGWLEEGKKTGPILLFLHGYPDSPEVWDPLVGHFTSRFQVIRPFSRGLAPSTRSGRLDRYGTDGAALDLLQLLAKVDPSGKRPVAVIGHDLGAVQACHLAPLLGSRLKTLVIFNGVSLGQFIRRLRVPRQLLKSWYIYLMQLPRLPELLVKHFPQRILRAGRGRLAAMPRRHPSLEVLTEPLNQYRAFFRDTLRQLRSPRRRLHCPVLVLWGVADPFLVTPRREEWEGFGSDVTLRLLKGGHWVFRERPGEVGTLLDEAFRRVFDFRAEEMLGAH